MSVLQDANFYMMHHALPNINAQVITVTATATLLDALINTAGSVTTFVMPPAADAIDIIPEGADIRVSFGGLVPTTTKGLILKSNTMYRFRGPQLRQMRLIRVGGADVSAGIIIGQTTNGEGDA